MVNQARKRLARFGALGAAAMALTVTLTGQSRPVPEWAAALPDATGVKAFIASQVQKNWTPPKTPWGDPDISGNFTTKDEANTPFERPEKWTGRLIGDITAEELAAEIVDRQQRAVEFAPFFGGGEPEDGVAIAVPIHWFDNLQSKNSRPWFVIDPPDGAVPDMTVEARTRPGLLGPGGGGRGADPQTRLRGGPRNSYTDRYLGDRCIMWGSGIPHSPTIYGNSFQILQTPDYVIFRTEMIHEARKIPLDGRPHVSSNIRNYMGDPRAYWDGNTLVIETINLQKGANYRAPGDHLRIIERLTRIAPNKVEWTMTFDDPTTWVRPWTYSLPMTQDDTQIIFEYACHEGNYGMANLLSAARAEDRKANRPTPR